MNILKIKSGQGDYEVRFFETLERLVTDLAGLGRAVLLVDEGVSQLYHKDLAGLSDRYPTLVVPSTEEEKTLAGVQRVLEFLQRNNAVKQTAIVAIGGGVIQDIATFASHVYYRGLKWIFVPTTLLSMADSCIGAKCGINFHGFKNQLGVFQSPAGVLICERLLDTLPEDEIRSGYGEILKLHLTRSGPEIYVHLEQTVRAEGWRNSQLTRFIRQSLEVKRGVIEEDEYERDLRRILNYGHTFGHALEAISRHAIPHGIAVAWGCDLANFIAWRIGLLAEMDFRTVHDFVRDKFHWRLPQPVTADELIAGVRHDKKVADGKINLILPDRPGSLRIVATAFDRTLTDAVAEYLKNHNAVSWD